MTLFEVEETPLPRGRKPLPKADAKPTWAKYAPKTPGRCDECVELAYESSPGPMLPIRKAKWSRRQGGKTRLYCFGHMRPQRDEDAETYQARERAS